MLRSIVSQKLSFGRDAEAFFFLALAGHPQYSTARIGCGPVPPLSEGIRVKALVGIATPPPALVVFAFPFYYNMTSLFAYSPGDPRYAECS
jgi:hypothetical protein